MNFKNIKQIKKIKQSKQQNRVYHLSLVKTTLHGICELLSTADDLPTNVTRQPVYANDIEVIDAGILLFQKYLADEFGTHSKLIKSFQSDLTNLTIIMQQRSSQLVYAELRRFITHQTQSPSRYRPTLIQFIYDWNTFEAHNKLVIKQKKAQYVEFTGNFGQAVRQQGVWYFVGQTNPEDHQKYLYRIKKEDFKNCPDDTPVYCTAGMFSSCSNITTEFVSKKELITMSNAWANDNDYTIDPDWIVDFMVDALDWLPWVDVSYVISNAEDFLDIEDYIVE